MDNMTQHQWYPQEEGNIEGWGPVGFPAFANNRELGLALTVTAETLAAPAGLTHATTN